MKRYKKDSPDQSMAMNKRIRIQTCDEGGKENDGKMKNGCIERKRMMLSKHRQEITHDDSAWKWFV